MTDIICPYCNKAEDFYYQSRYAEDKNVGWRCLGCHKNIVGEELIEELDQKRQHAKIACVVMDMQGIGILSYEDSSYSELTESIHSLCSEAEVFDEEFIIMKVSELAQVTV